MSDIRILKIGSENEAAFSIRDQPSLLESGPVALMQAALSNLMTTPGTDAMAPKRGGGLGDLCRRFRGSHAELKEAVSERIRITESRMLEEQKQGKKRPPSESLKSLELVDVMVSPEDPTEITINIGLRLESGEALSISI
jgi:hypothetical protein